MICAFATFAPSVTSGRISSCCSERHMCIHLKFLLLVLRPSRVSTRLAALAPREASCLILLRARAAACCRVSASASQIPDPSCEPARVACSETASFAASLARLFGRRKAALCIELCPERPRRAASTPLTPISHHSISIKLGRPSLCSSIE